MVLPRLLLVLRGALGDDEIPLDADTRFDALAWDSLDLVHFFQAVEAAFGVQIPDAEVDRLATVGDLSAFVDRAIDQQAAAARARAGRWVEGQRGQGDREVARG